MAKSKEKTAKKGPRYGLNHMRPYRSNISAIKKLFEDIKLEKKHIDQLKKTPFWGFFQPFTKGEVNQFALRKCDDDAVKIIESYDPDEKAFKIGQEHLRIRDSDISMIFGISSGNRPINLTFTSKLDTEFIKRRFADGRRLTPPIIRKLLLDAVKGKGKEDHKDVARLLILFAFITVFFSTSGQELSWSYIKYVEELSKMKDYAWAECILRTLMSSIEKYFTDPKRVTGCVIALLYWLCEHTKILKPEKEEGAPRFLKWDLGDLNKKLSRMTLGKLKDSEVLVKELTPSKLEGKKLATHQRSAKKKLLIKYKKDDEEQVKEENGEEEDEYGKEEWEEYEDGTEEQHQEVKGNELLVYQPPEETYADLGGDTSNLDMLVDASVRGASLQQKEQELVKEQEVLNVASDLRDKYERRITSLQNKISDLEKENEILKKNNEEKDAAKTKLECEREELKAYIHKLQEDVSVHTCDMKKKADTALQGDQESIVASLKEQLEGKLKAYDCVVADMENIVERLTKRNRTLEDQINDMAAYGVTQLIVRLENKDIDENVEAPIMKEENMQSSAVRYLKAKQQKDNKLADYTYVRGKGVKKKGHKRRRSDVEEEIGEQKIVDIEDKEEPKLTKPKKSYCLDSMPKSSVPRNAKQIIINKSGSASPKRSATILAKCIQADQSGKRMEKLKNSICHVDETDMGINLSEPTRSTEEKQRMEMTLSKAPVLNNCTINLSPGSLCMEMKRKTHPTNSPIYHNSEAVSANNLKTGTPEQDSPYEAPKAVEVHALTGRSVNECLAEENTCGATVDGLIKTRISTDSIDCEEDGESSLIVEKEPEGVAKEKIQTEAPAVNAGTMLSPTSTSMYFMHDVQEAETAIPHTAFQGDNNGDGRCSPNRESCETIGASVFQMASAFNEFMSSDEIKSADNSVVCVGPYFVRSSLAPTLHAIINKYGDIGRDCSLVSDGMLTFALEGVCTVVQDLQATDFNHLQGCQLKSLYSAITDAQLVKLDVEWLHKRYDELKETGDLIPHYKIVKDNAAKNTELGESKRKLLESKKLDILNLQMECDLLEGQLTSISAENDTLKSNIKDVIDKVNRIRHSTAGYGLL